MKQIFITKEENGYKVTYKGFSMIYSDLDTAHDFLKNRVDRDIQAVERELEDTYFYGKTDSRYIYFKVLEMLIKRRAVIRRQVAEMEERRNNARNIYQSSNSPR